MVRRERLRTRTQINKKVKVFVMKSYTIHLIRHGLTEANLSGRYAGATDIPVCLEGEARLKNLKENYEYPNVAVCYSSPLSRCVQTCNIIYPEIKPVILENLRECNFGDWEGKTTEELANEDGYAEWVGSGRSVEPPNGESGLDFCKRISVAFENIIKELVTNGTSSAAIFTHGGVIMQILSAYGLPKAGFYDWIVDNGCGYSIRVTPSLWMRDKVFEVYEKLPRGYNGEIKGEFKKLIENAKSLK